MKKCLSLALCLVLALGIIGCGGGGTSAGTWQEKYDLGIRYLSEGNYQEAILAFEAAIRIDPKRADAYLSLAQTYEAMGNAEAARAALTDGLAACGETAELTAALGTLTSGEERATPTPFEERKEYRAFDRLSGEQQALLRELMAAAVLADGTTIVKATGSEFPDAVYTQVDGWKMRVSQQVASDSIITEFELRPENGTGYLYEVRDLSRTGNNPETDIRVQSVTCPCVDWQWNGAYEMYATNVVKRDLNWLGQYWMQGMIEDGWRVGEFQYRYERQVEGREKDEPFERTDMYEKYQQSIFDWGYGSSTDQYITDRLYW